VTPRLITGIGFANALGVGGAEALFAALREAEVPLPARPLASFDASKYTDVAALEVPDFEPKKWLGDKGLRVLDRLTKLLVVSARVGLADAGLKADGEWTAGAGERVGICCSNAYGSLEAITELNRVAKLEDARYINPAKFPNTVANSGPGYVSIWEDLRALNVTVSDGNCGGLDAFTCADIFLEAERADQILTGGGEAMSEALYLAFCKLAGRGPAAASAEAGAAEGVRLGEGAALLCLETARSAEARGARVLARVTGFGTSFIAPEADSSLLTFSREATARAIRDALDDAGLEPSDVDVVSSGLCGIDAIDRTELSAIDDVLGTEVAVATPKAILGETLGAGGAMGVAAACAWLAGVPPKPLARGEAPAKVDAVLVTSVGYYGNTSAIVVQRA
jgi:3-oxoacyl-[acyl-carrier-protein] synthase II